MAIERAWALALILLGASGCASGQANDLARLRAITEMPVPTQLGPVDPDIEPEITRLLAAPLDVNTAVRVAIVNNRAIRATLRELGIERGMLTDARSVANPTIKAELFPERETQVELRVEYQISDLVLAPLRAKVAQSELDEARYRAAAELVVLGYRVRAAYRWVQAARERLAVGQRRLDALAAARDAALALEQAGNIIELDAASQIVGYERARVGVADLELELANRREALQRLLGLYGEHTDWELAEPLPPIPEAPPPMPELESGALTASLELAASRSRLDALAHRTGLERTQGWLPAIVVDYHALIGRPDAPRGASEGGVLHGGGISLAVPLVNQNRGRTRAAEAEYDGQIERYIGMSVDIRSAARELDNRIRSAHGVARHLARVVLPAQRRVLDQTLLQYNAMQIGVFQLLTAEQALLEVELAELAARATYWTTHAAYEALVAGVRVDVDRRREPRSLDARDQPMGAH